MQDRLLSYVEKISQILGRSSTFGIYGTDDIYQEIFLLVRDAQPKFDPLRSDDEFLFYLNFCKKRLKTLKRNNNVNVKTKLHGQKIKINNAAQINEELGAFCKNDDFGEFDENEFISEIVDKKIPANLRMAYLRLKHGADVNYHEKAKVLEAIKTIVRVNDGKV